MNEDHAKDYMRKSSDSFIYDDNLIEDEEKGFVSYITSDDALVILCCYGDGEHWHKTMNDKAKELGLGKVQFITKRSPGAFGRKYGYNLVGYMMEKRTR